VFITREPWFALGGNGVDVRSGDSRWETDIEPLCLLVETGEKISRTILATESNYRIKRVEPLGGFAGVCVGELMD
jgi:hypothetical protein